MATDHNNNIDLLQSTKDIVNRNKIESLKKSSKIGGTEVVDKRHNLRRTDSDEDFERDEEKDKYFVGDIEFDRKAFLNNQTKPSQKPSMNTTHIDFEIGPKMPSDIVSVFFI